jgi:hypothetical protein
VFSILSRSLNIGRTNDTLKDFSMFTPETIPQRGR